MTESPAETIRRAATLMRDRAEAARKSASGRWYVRTPQGKYPQSIADNASAVLIADTFEGPGFDQTTAPFIASWDPVVAEAVAKWLESWAGLEVAEGGPHSTDWEHALKIARAYLGERGRYGDDHA